MQAHEKTQMRRTSRLFEIIQLNPFQARASAV